MTEDSSEARQGLNPFSPTAVASVSEAAELVSVPTTATGAALQHLSRYIVAMLAPGERDATGDAAPAARSAPPGNVLGIRGDYGSGKTHLSVLLHNQVELENERRAGHPITSVYLDASASLLDLYYRFVEALTEARVHERVRRVYAEVVVDRLGGSDRAEPAREMLDDPELDPLVITSGLGLSEPDTLEELQRQLATITKNRDMAVVLSLVLRPAFRDRVWNWLRGAKPGLALREREITWAINDEESAVEAFTSLTRLYGVRGDPLVVIVDEMDRLLAACADEKSAPGRILPRFLQSFVSAGALLVLAALDESFDLLHASAQQRIGQYIRMPPFDVPETAQFVTMCLAKAGLTGLGPFTPDAVTEIVQLTEGNPRKIGKYCQVLFAEATTPITPEQVRRVARTHFGMDKRARVEHDIRRTLASAGWSYEANFFVSATPAALVDFWIPVGSESGCALLVTEAVVEPEDTVRLRERLAAVRAAQRDQGGPVDVLLVVVEAVASAQTPILLREFGREPMTYHPHSFPDDLVAAVKSIRQRLERIEGGDGNAVLRDEVERMSQQQDRLQDILDQVLADIRGLRKASEDSVRGLHEELAELRLVTAAIGDQERTAVDALPERVRHLFDDRLGELAVLGDAADVVVEVFGTDDPQDGLSTMRAVLRSPPYGVATALGVSAVLNRLIEQFRRAVDDWCRVRTPAPGQRLPVHSREELDELCRTYDAAFALIPLATLDRLAELAEAMPKGSSRRANLLLWSDRLFDMRQKLELLGADVRHVLLNSF